MRRTILVLCVVAVVLRLVISAASGTNYDLANIKIVAGWLRSDPLGVYALDQPRRVLTWPYPPGYFLVIGLVDWLSSAGVMSFEFAARLPVIAANVSLVWLVDLDLRRTGASNRRRIIASAVVLFSPLLVMESGWHGQIDLVATFAAAGFVVWTRRQSDAGALAAGLLIGIAACVKPPPALVLIALLSYVRSRRERARSLGGSILLPAAVLLPWAMRDFGALEQAAPSRQMS